MPSIGGGDQGPIGTGPNISRGTPIGSADDLSNPYYHNSGIAGGMQKYGGSYTNGSSLIDPASLYSDPNNDPNNDDQVAYLGGSKGFYDRNPGQLLDLHPCLIWAEWRVHHLHHSLLKSVCTTRLVKILQGLQQI
jgi:hypothetical protein